MRYDAMKPLHMLKNSGISSITQFDFPDNQTDTVPLLSIVRVLGSDGAIKPTTIYTHHRGDLNIDHRIVFEAVMTACRPVPNSSVRRILGYEVLSSTEWAVPGRMHLQPHISLIFLITSIPS